MAIEKNSSRGRHAKKSSSQSFPIPAFLLGNLIIYVFGVPWLMYSVPSITSIGSALAIGFMPFIAFDIAKIVLAGVALPTAWKMTGAK